MSLILGETDDFVLGRVEGVGLRDLALVAGNLETHGAHAALQRGHVVADCIVDSKLLSEAEGEGQTEESFLASMSTRRAR